MRIFDKISALLRRSNRVKPSQGISREEEKQLYEAIQAFKNRPIHKVLTEEIINSTPDNDLLQVVFDNLFEKLPKDHSKMYETVISWNMSRQAIFIIWIAEGQINNGGFNQFYFNSTGQFHKELPIAFKHIGANGLSKLTELANEIFYDENERIAKHQDGTLEGFSRSYEDNPLNKLDSQFYELDKTENLLQIQIEFVRKNIHDFVDQE